MRLSKSDQYSFTFLSLILLSTCLAFSLVLVTPALAEFASRNECRPDDSSIIDLDDLGEGEMGNLDLDQLISMIESDIEVTESEEGFPQALACSGCKATTSPASGWYVKGTVQPGKGSGKSEGWTFTKDGVVVTDNCKERAKASVGYFKDNFGITFSTFCTNGCSDGSTCVPRGLALSSNSPGSSNLDFDIQKYGWWTKKKRFSHKGGKDGEEVWFYVKNGCHCCLD